MAEAHAAQSAAATQRMQLQDPYAYPSAPMSALPPGANGSAAEHPPQPSSPHAPSAHSYVGFPPQPQQAYAPSAYQQPPPQAYPQPPSGYPQAPQSSHFYPPNPYGQPPPPPPPPHGYR
jgi:hypothetical protein